jgi:uncharacterized membrane protein
VTTADLVVPGRTVLAVDHPGTVLTGAAVAVRAGGTVVVGPVTEVVGSEADDVRHSAVEGRVLMRSRVLTTVDESAVPARTTELSRVRDARGEVR